MKDFLIDEINKYVIKNGEEYFDFLEGNAFKEPLIGFASAKDPIFNNFKEIIKKSHLTPSEAYELFFDNKTFEEGSVISIALPLSDEIIESNKQRDKPSKKWILMGYSGKIFLSDFSDFIKNILKEKGYDGVDPSSQEFFKITIDKNASSNWSLKHIAYACGMGTFCLNGGFITEKGRAILFLSFVTNLVLEPDKRNYKHHTANCLYYHNEDCKKCVERCPVNALSENGIDKLKCFDMSYGEKAKEHGKSLGIDSKHAYGCGLCLVGVPCESENPVQSKIKNKYNNK